MSNAVISFDHVVKEYKLFKNGRQRLKSVFVKSTNHKLKRAVDNVTFDVHQGESVAILGRNGAGKSTILKMITEVSYPTSGNLSVKGRVSALLELTSGFDPEFTGRENIYLKGSILGLTHSEIAALEQEIIDFSEIHEYIDQPVRTYSSGMKSRLGFSINVNIRPEILIVDEALSVGDAAFKNKCAKKVNEIINNDKVTLLFVTHSPQIAKSFCKRGIIMSKGKIVFDGKIEDAISEYNSMFQNVKK